MVVLVFMYQHLSVRYDAEAKLYIISTAGWILMAFLGYYVFSYKLRKSAYQQSRKSPVIHAKSNSERPKVVLKKERPKVNLKKKNDRHHGKS